MSRLQRRSTRTAVLGAAVVVLTAAAIGATVLDGGGADLGATRSDAVTTMTGDGTASTTSSASPGGTGSATAIPAPTSTSPTDGQSAWSSSSLSSAGGTNSSGASPHPAQIQPPSSRERTITAAAGPRASATSSASGDVWVKANGTTLSRKRIDGSLYITGSDVTIRDVSVGGNVFVNQSPTGGIVSPVPSDVALVHVRARGVFSNGFDGLTIQGVELTGQRDAPHAQLFNYADPSKGATFPAQDLFIEDSWFHGVLPSTTSAHIENLHVGGVRGAVIRDNVFELHSPDGGRTQQQFTANLAMEPAMYGVFSSNFIVEDNVFRGGGAYQVYLNATGVSRVAGNRFFSDSPAFAAVQYPPSAYVPDALPPGGYVRFAQSGNTLDGRPLRLPGGR